MTRSLSPWAFLPTVLSSKFKDGYNSTKSKVSAHKCRSFSFLSFCNLSGYTFPSEHKVIFMTGKYKIYKIGPKYQSLKDLWVLHFAHPWLFIDLLSTYIQRFFQSLNVNALINTASKPIAWISRMGKGQVNKLPASSEQEFHGNGQSPSILNYRIQDLNKPHALLLMDWK